MNPRANRIFNANIDLWLTLIVLLIFVWGIISCRINSDKDDIQSWARSRGESTVNIEFRVWDTGPYFYIKNARFYRVQTDANVYWVKYFWGRTINKEVGKQYEIIK